MSTTPTPTARSSPAVRPIPATTAPPRTPRGRCASSGRSPPARPGRPRPPSPSRRGPRREVLEHGPQEQGHEHGEDSGDDPGQLALAPARWLTALWEKPPAGGMHWDSPPARAANPLASSSWSLSTGGSARWRCARATRTVSMNAITAIASAPGSRAPMSLEHGHRRGGQSRGDLADERETVLLDVGQSHEQDAAGSHDQWAGDLRGDSAKHEQHDDRCRPRHRRWLRSRRRAC